MSVGAKGDPRADGLRSRTAPTRGSSLAQPVPPRGVPLSMIEAQRLLPGLHVHPIERELQNDELQQSRHTLSAVVARNGDLYDFAPVGHVTLDHRGAIVEANLTAARLLGSERARLSGQPFATFVADDDRGACNAHHGRSVTPCT